MFYFPRARPHRESEQRSWRDSPHLTVMPNRTAPRTTERVRIHDGMSPETVLVTGYFSDGTPATRMEIPRRWLTPQWVAWMESRIAQDEGVERPTLQLLG